MTRWNANLHAQLMAGIVGRADRRARRQIVRENLRVAIALATGTYGKERAGLLIGSLCADAGVEIDSEHLAAETDRD
jgi:hypothetical protein